MIWLRGRSECLLALAAQLAQVGRDRIGPGRGGSSNQDFFLKNAQSAGPAGLSALKDVFLRTQKDPLFLITSIVRVADSVQRSALPKRSSWNRRRSK